MQKLSSETILPEAAWKALQAIYDGRQIISGAQACEWAGDQSRARPLSPLAVVTPLTHEQVLDTVAWANSYGIALVPSGGRTGLSGGACAGQGELVVSLARMNRLLEFDVQGGLLTVEAGMTLQSVQELAELQGWFYPVDYASRGSAQIGGAVASNAGGIRVLRYGMTRDWIAGLKAVTGAGETLSINRHLVKDNAGYELKHLLAGSEGTLAIITEVTLRLTRPMGEQTTLLAGFASFAEMVTVFARLRQSVTLNAAEFFCAGALARVVAAHGYIRPLQADWAFYLLLEFDRQALADEQLSCLFAAQEVIVSHSVEQTRQLWRYREQLSSTINPLHPSKNDIACRLALLPGWIADLEQGFREIHADIEVLWFGHLGDGNVHVNVLRPTAMTSSDFEAVQALFSEVLARVTTKYSATASAEHGIGCLKKSLLASSRSAVEISLYRQIKQVFDPNGILNPGKIF